MQERVYTQTTDNITITVSPAPIEQQSDIEKNIYSFSYTVRIENRSGEVVQLIERHWQVYSAGHQIAEVVGPGVVGEQPTLAPGKKYSYTSGTVINDPFGEMVGSYTFKTKTGRFFLVAIPKFELVYPVMYH